MADLVPLRSPEPERTVDDTGVTLSRLLAEFDRQTLSVLTAPTGIDSRVCAITLADVGPAGGAMAGSLHLASTSVSSAAEITRLITACAQAEATGVILRRTMCTPGIEELAQRTPRLAVLQTDDTTSWPTLFSRLTGVLAGLSRVDDTSTLEVPLGDLFTLANAIATLVGGATAIEDISRRVLAYSTISGQEVDEIRQNGILGRQVPSFPGNDETYLQMWRANKAVRVVSGYPGHLPRVCVAVRVGAEPLGSIWVIEGEKAFDSDDYTALNQAAAVAAVHLMRYRAGSGMVALGRATLLTAHLRGEAHPSTLRQLGMDPKSAFGVITCRVTGDPPDIVLDRIMAMIQFSERTHDIAIACTVLRPDTVGVLISASQSITTARLRGLAQAAVDRIRTVTKIDVIAAVSTVSDGAVGIATAARQTDQVLRLANASPDNHDSVLVVEPSGATLYLLDISEATTSITSPYRALVARIEEFDAQHGTCYFETLVAFFRKVGDLSAVAASLCVHRNTLRYRLNRINEIFQLDLDEPDTRLAIWLFLRLRELGDKQ